jgi:hypothetical protein
MTGPFLVHCPRRYLLGGVLVATSIFQALLDVLVLPVALLAPSLPRHGTLSFPTRR